MHGVGPDHGYRIEFPFLEDADAATIQDVLTLTRETHEATAVYAARNGDTAGAADDPGAAARPLREGAPPPHYQLPEFGLDFEFLPTDFVQVNGELNRRAVSRAVELLAPAAGERVLDLFCGLGNFSLALARRGSPGDRGLRASGVPPSSTERRRSPSRNSTSPDTT